MSEAAKHIEVHKKIGDYKILKEVGIGGLGRVFKAENIKTGEIVAIKVLHQKYMADKRFLGIFHRELMIQSGLSHKHIVGFRDSYFKPPLCYVVTDFIDGYSGFSLLKKVKKVPPLVGICILIDMLQAIDYLHLRDTVHADLSSANYMIEKSGRVYVMDFGLSCRTEIENFKNYMVGTPGYYAPEHISENPITPQTDLYCIGILLYEMLTGQKPIPVIKDRKECLSQMKKINFKIVTANDYWMQMRLRKLLKKLLAIRASRRIQTTEELMLICISILQKYRIRYSRMAIKRFLIDQKLREGPYEGPNQNIYQGFKGV